MLPKEPGAGRVSSSGEREPHAAISLSLAQALWRNASSNSSFITPPLSGQPYRYGKYRIYSCFIVIYRITPYTQNLLIHIIRSSDLQCKFTEHKSAISLGANFLVTSF